MGKLLWMGSNLKPGTLHLKNLKLSGHLQGGVPKSWTNQGAVFIDQGTLEVNE
jgi:hypothetical protein